jgi:glycosyltransferase involved in cell wall biosynthesis
MNPTRQMNPPGRINILLYGRSGAHRGVGPDTYTRQLISALSGRCTLGEFAAGFRRWQEWDVMHILDMKHVSPKTVSECPIPIVMDVHDSYWLEKVDYPCTDRWLRMWLNRRRRKRYPKLLAQASRIVVHSQFVQTELANFLPSSQRQNAVYVPYSVMVDDQLESEISSHPPRILFVGRDLFRKGFPTLIDALELLVERVPDAELGVIGKEYWHSQGWARRRCRNLPVILLGGLSPADLHQEILGSDVVVLPSYIEAFGIVLLEAQALGIPVVGSRVGGISEAMEDGVTGVLVPPDNPKALADALESLLHDPARRQKMGEQGKMWVREHYSLSGMGDRLMELYRSVITLLN